MTTYTFDGVLAYDPSAGIAKGATFVTYAVGDEAEATPLTTVDLNGLALTVTSNGDGMLTTIRVEDEPQIVLASGPYRVKLTAVESILEAAAGIPAAVAAAQTAASQMTSEFLEFLGHNPNPNGVVVLTPLQPAPDPALLDDGTLVVRLDPTEV